MLTADIALEDAVLDLVDNAIDSLARSEKLQLSEELLFKSRKHGKPTAYVSVHLSEDEIRVEDNCGGIEKSEVMENVFRIGRVIPQDEPSLGVYGIGLKRAIFKMGNAFELRSRTNGKGFRAYLDDIDKWARSDDLEWTLPVDDQSGARAITSGHTRLSVRELREPVLRRIREGTLLSSLKSAISRTYPLFLGRLLKVSINGVNVEPIPVPVAGSNKVGNAVERITLKKPDVRITLIAGVAAQDDEEWTGANAGWYVICNGRVVLAADKSELTGWGTKSLPQYHSKYRAFVGVAFFFSDVPAALPWTTTKRGINRDSMVFQQAQPRMAIATRQVLAFLNRLYPGEQAEAPAERETAASVKQRDVRELALSKPSAFRADVSKRGKGSQFRIQFDVTAGELEKARRCIGKPSYSGVKVGRYAFDYLLRHEGKE
jgi:hypothetical protein